MRAIFRSCGLLCTGSFGACLVADKLDLENPVDPIDYKVGEISRQAFQSLKWNANSLIQKGVDQFPRLGWEYVRCLEEKNKNQLKQGPSAVELGHSFFGKYEKLPTFRGDTWKAESSGFFPPMLSYSRWNKGFLFNQAFVTDKGAPGSEDYTGGITGGAVSQSLNPTVAKCFASNSYIYGISADKTNSFSTAAHMERDDDDLEQREIVSTSIQPSQFLFIAKLDHDQNITSFKRGPVSLDHLPRTKEMELFLDQIRSSSTLSESEKNDIQKMKKEWAEVSPEEPIPAIDLFVKEMASSPEELAQRAKIRIQNRDQS
ncbi:hypothetical protein [Candidatus Neptunichlamydia sp. REUL1]|uniref:hypothetical protein n=1 Tax=Candidatus Neptunichlamydia sp. REUL1 TaxID=3064277 RepID=UPI0029318C13|nr:hypothetical protein [Candidatus Neptunochlamydia sp. REUL1]